MIISANKNGQLDAPTYNLLKEISIEIPIVQLNTFSGYEFDEKLYNLKGWVLADFLELGANDWDRKETLLWGKNSELFSKANTEEWQKFDKFVTDNPPLLTFKRELLKKDFKNNVYPIEFACHNIIPPVQSKSEFLKRPIEMFHYWGHSNEARRMFHGNVFVNSTKSGYGVADNFYHIETAIKEYNRLWVTIQTPHYSRLPIEQVLFVNGHSKLSVSFPGAGVKCFRSTGESPVNSALVMQEDNLAWTYEWKDKENCFKIPIGETMDDIRGLTNQWAAIETIEAALQNPNLYDIYCETVATCKKYHIADYVKNYLEPTIQQYL